MESYWEPRASPKERKWGWLAKAVSERGAGRISRFQCVSTLGWWFGKLGVVGVDEETFDNKDIKRI